MKLTRQQITDENLQLREAVKRQTRELEIEAALERVRRYAMAMSSSDELNTIIGKVFTECIKLDIQLDRGIIMIFDPQSLDSWWWMANPEAPDLPKNYHVPYNTYEPYLEYLNGWEKRTVRWTYVLEGKKKKDWDAHIFVNSELSLLPTEVKQVMMGFTKVYLYASFNNFGGLTLASIDPMAEEHFDILLRFANVFELTYTRFNDLKQAEGQARKAQIEAALERVRSRTIAMKKSDELAEVAVLLFKQVSELGIKTWTAGFNVWSEDGNSYTDYITSPQGNIIKAYTIDTSGFSVFRDVRDAKNRGEQFWVQYLEGELLKETYRELSKFGEEKQYEKMLEDGFDFPSSQYVHFVFGSQVSLMFITYEPILEAHDIFKRFGIVFQQTYTRFLDLQKAEAQAKETIKASSLDRVRAQIASMRTIDDLQQITPLIWKELNALEVPFVRCGVFIINESSAHIQLYLSSSDGHSLAVLDLPFDASELICNIVNHWRKALLFTTHWNKEEFLNWMQTMIRTGQVQNRETYQGASQPPESLDLHFIPFKQGMLYVGNIAPLDAHELNLVKSLAESFSIAYARYEDFRQLEEAKNQIEKTFIELKATQSQLIHSEKMASLGELTAGIAHEIQNPLNFVNNFSEVSRELLDEMKDEIRKGNFEEVQALTDDIKQNLEKILYHGKRADGIVKGMLQHSRSSSGVKEPTDINALADEYLRLAFHGSRAKDKTFNATLKTDFDQNIGLVKVVPQDIGRAVLNLINNAFYAVIEKKNQQIDGYEPTVSVSTKNMADKVLICVKDNGPGIPQRIIDKIFQPFFTTKPTGQGTGLGLSLSYDLVKAHGGELKVNTKEGEGSEFVVVLPI